MTRFATSPSSAPIDGQYGRGWAGIPAEERTLTGPQALPYNGIRIF
jgi:hypothetical protein